MNIAISKPRLSASALRYVTECFETNQISQGRFVGHFEDLFKVHMMSQHAIACSNGTMALFLALRALGIEDGEVIVPTLTFGATADAVLLAGATLVFVDVDPVRLHLTAETIQARITPQTRAIIAVDLYGIPCPVEPLRYFGLPIIKDAAESLGGFIPRGDITCFSFFGNKIITTGEGGMCITDDARLADRMKQLRNHGRQAGYWHELRGTNARMTNIQAAMGCSQLEDIDQLVAQRRMVFAWYRQLLPDMLDLSWPADPISPWFFIVTVPAAVRDGIIARLKEAGVDSRHGFKPLHTMPAYWRLQILPHAESVCNQIILLPCHPGLTKDEVRYICSFIGG